MADIRAWHRWLAVEGEGRATARLFTGWANVVFLFIVTSGLYLWFPRKWTWQHLRPNVMFNGSLRGKARDFNWHHVFGVWSLVPLFLIVLTALPMSFPWANAALYRIAGDDPPTPPRARGAEAAPVTPSPESLNALWDRAVGQAQDWRTIVVRMPGSANAPLTAAIDRGNGGQPQLRSTLTLDRQGDVVRYERFSDQRPGARLRAVSRFTHTGEILGPTGQTIAGLASVGASVLTCTGLMLAFRRFRAWLKRRSDRGASAAVERPAA